MAVTRKDQNQALFEAVRSALRRYDPIRSSDSVIEVAGSNGTVILTGLVRSRIIKSMAEKLVRQVPGVTNVRNQLLADTDVETAVASELAMNEASRQAGGIIQVKSLLGTVYLAGDIATSSVAEAEELKQLAESLAESVPGVNRVVNAIIARERGQVVVTAAQDDVGGGPSAEVAAKLAELRERRENWAQRAASAAG